MKGNMALISTVEERNLAAANFLGRLLPGEIALFSLFVKIDFDLSEDCFVPLFLGGFFYKLFHLIT